MSFFLTTNQVISEIKTVTRRLGWNHAYPGMYCWAVEKGQGIKKGELRRLKLIRIKSIRKEELSLLRQFSDPSEELKREGFPDLTAQEFVDFFCKEAKCKPDQLVNRVQFEYVRDLSGQLLEVDNKAVNKAIPMIEAIYQRTGKLEFSTQPLWIEGWPGSGKTWLAEKICKEMGLQSDSIPPLRSPLHFPWAADSKKGLILGVSPYCPDVNIYRKAFEYHQHAPVIFTAQFPPLPGLEDLVWKIHLTHEMFHAQV